MTINRDLIAARNVDFAPTIELEYSGDPLPLEGAIISMEVRQYAGQPGIHLAQDASVAFEDDAGATVDDPRILQLSPRIEDSVLSGFPTGLNQPEVGEADRFSYEIIVTYADGDQDSLMSGAFILEPGVNTL